MTGGVITAASSTPGPVSAAAAGQQQASSPVVIFFNFILSDSCFFFKVIANQRAVPFKMLDGFFVYAGKLVVYVSNNLDIGTFPPNPV